jgi:hypothetical protein
MKNKKKDKNVKNLKKPEKPEQLTGPAHPISCFRRERVVTQNFKVLINLS